MTALSCLLGIRWYGDGFQYGADPQNLEESAYGFAFLSAFILVFIASLLSPADIPATVKLKVGAVINCGITLFTGALVIIYLFYFLPLFFKLDAMFPATQSMLIKFILRTGVHTTFKKAVLEVSTRDMYPATAGHAYSWRHAPLTNTHYQCKYTTRERPSYPDELAVSALHSRYRRGGCGTCLSSASSDFYLDGCLRASK